MEIDALLASSEWINAGGILLILVGISFLILEFFLPSFGLFGFAGVASVLIGIVQLYQTGYIDEMPISVNGLIGLAILGMALSVAGGWYSWNLYRKKVTTGIEGMIGDSATVIDWKDMHGRISILGEDWQAYSDAALHVKKGDKVIVTEVDGLKIKVTSQN